MDYWRNYSSLLETGKRFGVSEATACRTYKFIEDCLAKGGLCKLPGKKGFTTDTEESFTVDATECPVERPKRKSIGRVKNRQKHYYSGKKKRHTIKAQIVIKGRSIRSTAFANGRMHDYKLFKKSKTKFRSTKNVKVDSGYQGLQKVHPNPFKIKTETIVSVVDHSTPHYTDIVVTSKRELLFTNVLPEAEQLFGIKSGDNLLLDCKLVKRHPSRPH